MPDKSATLSSKHPDYTMFKPDWDLMRDTYRGQRQVKSKGAVYLPYTSGHVADGIANEQAPGQRAYQAYKLRARFANYVRQAVQIALGMLHHQPGEIELPDAMKNIRSSRGETMDQLLMRINKEQLLMGRCGLMLDLPVNSPVGEDMPYLALYSTERIINWDNGTVEDNVPQSLNLVVLDESEDERIDTFSWEKEEKYRVLTLGPPSTNEGSGRYRFGVFSEDDGFLADQLRAASFRGRQLNFIPFWFINAVDHVVEPEDPPLLDLAELCLTIYRGDADYRQNLFMQGQDTFVTMGANLDDTDDVRTGAGARLDLPAGGKAEYVGVTSDGLSEQRDSLEHMHSVASSMGAQSTDTVSRERESGKSLNIRLAARTADLNQIAISGAAGLERALRAAAEWMGENPEEVRVIPNMEFGDAPITGQMMVDMAAAKNQGWPISERTMHDIARQKGLTRMEFEEEMKLVEEERERAMERAQEAVDAGTGGGNGDRNPAQGGGDRRGGSGGDNGGRNDGEGS